MQRAVFYGGWLAQQQVKSMAGSNHPPQPSLRILQRCKLKLEHNKALTIFGTHLIETSVSLKSLAKDIDISSKVLTRLIAEVSNVNSSCALDGHRLGLERVIRVSSKTDASNSAILCAAFRAFFGAVATDSGMVDERRTRFS
ncbi:PREDICTED: protein NUCLEAR FUSION DEFECTIVE 2 [Brassica oleracea var. oleracea]|nr:PREDICTED: protein NUCLEAR FUSION DEFECTIVE 2 [Brassica oleracea var. oleracea]